MSARIKDRAQMTKIAKTDSFNQIKAAQAPNTRAPNNS